MGSSKRAPEPLWTRSASKRLVRKPLPIIPDYNFRFLQLPTEIRLLICEYLSYNDLFQLSSTSEDFKKFFDEYFVNGVIYPPPCDTSDTLEYSNTQGRYILTMYVNFIREIESDSSVQTKPPISPITRAKCVEAVKLLNLAQMREITMETDMTVPWLDLPTTELCPWYMEICSFVFKSALHLQRVNISILRCEKSLAIIETLVSNAPNLKHVTLRNPRNPGIIPPEVNEILDPFPYSLLRIVRCLLEKSNITKLSLSGYELYEYQESLGSSIKSDTLEKLSLIIASSPEEVCNYSGDCIKCSLICPELIKLTVNFNYCDELCLFHFAFVGLRFVEGLVDNSTKLKTYNMRPIKNYFYRDHFYCDSWCTFNGRNGNVLL